MADVPLTGPIKWSDLRAVTKRTNAGGFSASDLNTHNLNQPTKTTAVVASKTRGTPTAVPRRFSTYVQNSIQGLYSMKLANPDYTGPVVNVRRASDSAVLDFYADVNGTLRDATGLLYSTWISGTTGSVLIWYDQAQNDMAVLQYPPSSITSLGTSNPVSTTLSGAPYGNGGYTFSASSQYSTGECVGFAFDNQGGAYHWWTIIGNGASPDQNYNPNYVGTSSTTVSGVAYAGAWIQMQLPYAIYPTGYFRSSPYLFGTSAGARFEISHVLAGSNDGTNWTLLNAGTDPRYTVQSTVNINISSSYSYFRLIGRASTNVGWWSVGKFYVYGRQSLTPTRNALATSASGGNPPQLVLDPGTSGKYVIYFPNGSASASAYYGFTMTSQPTASCMINYRTIYNSSGWQSLLCTVSDNQGVRFNGNNLNSGDGNDFLNPGGYAIYDGTYNATSTYFTNSDGAWHTMCASRNSNSQLNFIHIGHCDVTFNSGSLLSRSFYGYMSEVITMSTSLMTLTASSTTTAPDYDLFWKTTHVPNWNNGLIASYAPENWTGSAWNDALGTYNASSAGTPVLTSTTGMEGLYTSLSSGAQSGVRGIYSCRRINTNYTGPTFNIRRGSDSATLDFYANGNGDLGTAVGATGQSLTEWLGMALPYIATWYDQSGQGRHATQSTTGSQPIYRAASKRVDFNTALFLNLPNGTIPMQVPYTFIVRHGYLTNPYSGILGGGINATNQCNNIRADPSVGYYQYWYANDISAGSAVQRPENTLSVTFSGPTTSGTTYMYLNGSQIATNSRSGWAAVAGNECLGRNEQGTNPMNGTMYDAWIFATALDGTDRPLIENTLMNASKTLPVLYGNTSDGINFPSMVPSTYSLFHLTRYNKNTYGLRIYQGRTQNWLSGHWNYNQGIIFHQGWGQNVTNYYPYPSGTPQWLLVSDQNTVMRCLTMNHALFGSLPSDYPPGYYGQSYDPTISINGSGVFPGEFSAWSTQYCLLYNRSLSTKESQQVEDYMATRFKVPIPIQEGLAVSLDANEYLNALNGTAWKDRSPYAQNFVLANTSQYVSGSQQFQYMDCTSYGTTFSSAADVSFSTHNTFIWFGTIKNSTGDWRTLLRGYSNDHNVIVENGSNRLGLYNNPNGGFIACDMNVDVSSLDQVYTRFNMHVWKLSTQCPYYQYYFNPSSAPCKPTGVITDGRANLGHGFYALGMWQGPGQYFGQCGTALWYNRELSDEELVETYRRFAPRYDLPSPLIPTTPTSSRGQIFTRSGMWIVPAGVTSVNILVIGGGGGGGGGWEGGGGGAGGLVYGTGYGVTPGAYISVIVGRGGYGSRRYSLVQNGESSIFGTVTAYGGGAGGAEANSASIYPYQSDPQSGGSGGGAGWGTPSGVTFVGSGIQPSNTAFGTGYGNAGGQTYNGAPYLGGGGGGAGAVGGTGTVSAAGNGGAGLAITIMGMTKTYCGGGGGSLRGSGVSSGGSGGGGAGNGTGAGYDATYYGSGGGAGGGNGTNPNGGTGFQGIVIVEY